MTSFDSTLLQKFYHIYRISTKRSFTPHGMSHSYDMYGYIKIVIKVLLVQHKNMVFILNWYWISGNRLCKSVKFLHSLRLMSAQILQWTMYIPTCETVFIYSPKVFVVCRRVQKWKEQLHNSITSYIKVHFI